VAPRPGRLRALAFAGLAAVFAVLFMQVPIGGLIAYAELSGRGVGWIETNVLNADQMPPLTLLLVNLSLGCLAPGVLLAARVLYAVRPGRLLAAAGRSRRASVARAFAVVLPVWLLYVGWTYLVDGLPRGGVHPQALALLLVALLTTPLQVLGEEAMFRLVPLIVLDGLAGPRARAIGRVGATVVSASAFVLVHGSTDLWTDAGLATFSVAAVYLTVVSKGLEEAWVVHLVNNLLTQVSAILLGGWGSSFIGQSGDEPDGAAWTPIGAVPALAVIVVLLGVLRRRAAGRPRQRPTTVVSGRAEAGDSLVSSSR
jgi:membrane protease YdiL (CAAX protease family)